MEEKKKGGKRAAPNRRGWLLAVLVLARTKSSFSITKD